MSEAAATGAPSPADLGAGDAPAAPSTAADYATTDVPTASPAETVGELRGRIAGRRYACAEDVVVLEGPRLAGVISIEALLAASPAAPVSEIMNPDPPVAAPDTDRELVARAMVERHEGALAVVDSSRRFLGLVPQGPMLAVLLEEHHEDLARLGGYVAGAARARRAAREPVAQRLWHRLPWLLVGLVGAMASALIVSAFEHRLEANVVIAFFIPAVVYMADAVGTQTEAVLIRALAAGVTVRQVLRQELLTGVGVGVVIGLAFLPFAAIVWGEGSVAIALAVALFASCSIATGVAMVLPAVLQRLGRDPAFGSGPLATVVQDLLSIAVYLGVTIAIV